MTDGLLVWMDLEMTGLNFEHDHILEIATIITNTDLQIIAEGPELIINQPEEVIRSMNEWCQELHVKSGLVDAVRASNTSLAAAEQQTLEFIKEHVAEHKAPLCGNSIHQDRVFLRAYMPSIENYLHYRNIDVSTVKELAKAWVPTIYSERPKKHSTHRALDDVKESIAELQFYWKSIFKNDTI